MKRWLILLMILPACWGKAKQQDPTPKLAATAQGFAQPVNIVDGPNQGATILGASTANPLIVSATGVGGTVTVNNDGSAPVPVDTTPGEQLSAVVHFVAAVGAGSVPDASTFVGANICNRGVAAAYWQFYCGQVAIDAGGTADAGTAPCIIDPYLPPNACTYLTEVQTITGGAAVWYSSSTQGLLTVDAGVSNMSVDLVRR